MVCFIYLNDSWYTFSKREKFQQTYYAFLEGSDVGTCNADN